MDIEEARQLLKNGTGERSVEMPEIVKQPQQEDEKDLKQDIIEKCTGILGLWHIWVFVLACILKIPIAWYQLNIVFLAPNVKYSCEDERLLPCSRDCDRHIFDNTTFTRTIISEWDLVCNREYIKTLAQSLTMSGLLCGNFIFGYLSDRYGRRRILILAIMIQCTSGTAMAFCPWLAGFLILRFLVGFSLGGTTVTSFVVVMETVGLKWRTLLALLYQLPFNLGQILLPIISYNLRDWRHFQLAISLPTMLLISYYWLLPESPRWQLAVGKKDAAISSLQKAAKMNKLPTKNIENDISMYLQIRSNTTTKQETKKETFLDLFRTPIIRMYTMILWITWFSCGCSFFGGSQFVGNLGGNIFFNVALSAVLQIPGALFVCWSIQAWGRKGSMIFGNTLAGIALLATAAAPDDPSWLKPVLASIGLSGLNTSFGTIYIYAGEIFPTVVRNLGIGTASTCARLGSMVAPLITDSFTNHGKSVPPIFFGTMMFISALLCCKLPETYNCKLPETIEEVEQLEKKKKKTNLEAK